MSNSLTITKLSDLIITVAGDGGVTLAYSGQTTITQSPGTCYRWVTYGILGSTATPLILVSTACPTPTGLKTESYINNGALSLSLGTNSASKYAIIGSGDMRPMGLVTAISISIDNESAGSSGPFPNYAVVCTTGSGTGATITFYHP